MRSPWRCSDSTRRYRRRKAAALRKFAWRFDTDPDKGAEYFSCASVCRKTGTNLLSLTAQADRNCCLPGHDTSTWKGQHLVKIYMGAPTRYDREGKDGDWNKPNEDPRESGCPGAWYRTDFVGSVLHYYRNKDEHGGRIANRALDLCDDPLVIEAINRLESYENAWRSEVHRRMDDKHKK